MFVRPRCELLLLVMAVIAVWLASPTASVAQINGIWWYCDYDSGAKSDATITLINLTDVPLNATANTVVVDGWQYAVVPFEYFGAGGIDAPPLVSVPPYRTVIWKGYTASFYWFSYIHYSGKITFLPQGMDLKWSFDLNFTPDSAYGLAGDGTWLHLTPTHPDNTDWIDTWSVGNQMLKPFYPEGGTPFPVYATPLADGKMHNQMNLLGWDLAVSLYSSSKNRVVMVVRQTHGHKGTTLTTNPDPYRGWLLDWVDDGRYSVPHK